jgi:hypothetical protein
MPRRSEQQASRSYERTATSRRRAATLAVAIVVGLIGAGCSSSSSAPAASSTTGDEQGCGTVVEVDPANFVDPTLDTNPYHPLKPGLQWVRGGSTLVGQREVPHEVITTMTDVIREIDGIPTVAMLDESTDSSEVSQVGMDYMALDVDGNVWILGGYTEEYEGGEYTNTESAWLGSGDGQMPGILAPADVTMDTLRWCIGAAPDEAPSVGEPTDVGVQECVAFGCYDDVRVVQEGNVGAPDNENKYYAPGVGVINNIRLDAPDYTLAFGAVARPVVLLGIATAIASLLGSRLVNTLEPTELLRDE